MEDTHANQPCKDQLSGPSSSLAFRLLYCCDSRYGCQGPSPAARDLRSMLLGLAIAGAACAVWCLLRFLRSNDEREQQINYRALNFAFIGTLIFSLAIGFAQSIGFHSVSWLGIPALMVVLRSFGLFLYSWRYR
jgi:hypothetical protein